MIYRHARDIPDIAFLDAVKQAGLLRLFDHSLETRQWFLEREEGPSASQWDVASLLGGHGVGDDCVYDVPGIPSEVVVAKAKRLIARGLLDGCACGCRGDWTLTSKARRMLLPSPTTR